MEERLTELENIVRNMVKVGVVESFDEQRGTVKVIFKDIDIKSYDLPIMVKQALHNKDYWIPDIGESVICVFLPTGIESGFCLGAYYNKKDTSPIAKQNKRHMKFKDNTTIEYDRESHKLTLDIKGDIIITNTGFTEITSQGHINIHSAGAMDIHSDTSINITAPRIDLN